MYLVYHPVHAPTMPRSCQTLEEVEQLKKNGWYTESDNPSPIPPGDVPPTNADESNKPPAPTADASPSSEGNAGAREEEKVGDDGKKEDDPADDAGKSQVTDLNVGEAKEVISAVTDLDALKAIEKEEKKNKNRVGVLDAIAEQRELIKHTDPNK